jgi:hypothetical protein
MQIIAPKAEVNLARSFSRKMRNKPQKTEVCLPAASEERFWNEHVGWKSVISVEHDGIVYLNCRYSKSELSPFHRENIISRLIFWSKVAFDPPSS